VRLTAPDGYQARRAYSLASPPEDPELALTVERLEGGEVSPYLTREVRPGDVLEIRGPLGGHFVWDRTMGGPLLLLAGGSGLVPLMAMLRHRRLAAPEVPARLLHSCRSPADRLYADELAAMAAAPGGPEVHFTFTRQPPPGWTGPARRVDAAMLAAIAWPPARRPRIYVCGPTGFVEAVAAGLCAAGHDPGRIRTERFGPSA
jgi:ferredoxin-NADP reductase